MSTATAPTPIDYFESGRRAVWLLVDVCRGDLAQVERIINDTEAALTEETRANGKKHCLTMRSALRQLTTARAIVKGKLELGVQAADISRQIEQAEALARVEGYLTPRLANDFRAQRWALLAAILS